MSKDKKPWDVALAEFLLVAMLIGVVTLVWFSVHIQQDEKLNQILERCQSVKEGE